MFILVHSSYMLPWNIYYPLWVLKNDWYKNRDDYFLKFPPVKSGLDDLISQNTILEVVGFKVT